MFQNLIHIGFSKKPKGVTGELVLNIFNEYDESIVADMFLFFEINGCKVPYLIESIKYRNQKLVSIQNIKTPQQAQLLKNRKIYLEPKQLKKNEVSTDIKKDWIGFAVISDGKSIGQIVDIQQFPEQIMVWIKLDNGKEKMIPWVEDFVRKVDSKSKTALVELPEGLLELD